MTARGPVVLVVRDGWGRNPHPEHDAFNAIHLAATPRCDALLAEYPWTLIKTSGEDVGLPEGTMGNSEVGHQNLGAGRIVDQESVRISKAIRDGSFFDNPVLRAAVGARTPGSGVVEGGKMAGPGAVEGRKTPATGAGATRGGAAKRPVHARGRAAKRPVRVEGGAAKRPVHVMGIASDAGVHGLLEHLYATLELCRRQGAEEVYVHLFTDGRDTGPFTGRGYVSEAVAKCEEIGVGRVVTVCGRYWAMDRDQRWGRIERAYDCLTGRGEPAPNFATTEEAIADYYESPTNDSQQGDEFVTPRTVGDDWRDTRIGDGATVVFANYRGDRPRQLTKAFVYEDFHGHVPPSPEDGERGFDRGDRLDLAFVTMTAYEEELDSFVEVAFPKPPKMEDVGGGYLSRLGLTQFRCAETEKFPHVTFFFNDYRDEPFPGERREMAQSPGVATYDLQPEMSAREVCDAMLARLEAADCESFLLVNFANTDMVGHTGKLDAAVRAAEVVDGLVGEIVDAALARGGRLLVTADHGNSEQMWDPETEAPHTAHTTYDVELILVDPERREAGLRDGGRLADVMPTVLELLGLEVPAAMTGRSLIGR